MFVMEIMYNIQTTLSSFIRQVYVFLLPLIIKHIYLKHIISCIWLKREFSSPSLSKNTFCMAPCYCFDKHSEQKFSISVHSLYPFPPTLFSLCLSSRISPLCISLFKFFYSWLPWWLSW